MFVCFPMAISLNVETTDRGWRGYNAPSITEHYLGRFTCYHGDVMENSRQPF